MWDVSLSGTHSAACCVHVQLCLPWECAYCWIELLWSTALFNGWRYVVRGRRIAFHWHKCLLLHAAMLSLSTAAAAAFSMSSSSSGHRCPMIVNAERDCL